MTDTGVAPPRADAIRIPAPLQALVDRVRAWPRIPQAFVGLALLDVLGRAIGVVAPGLYLSTDDPVSWFTAFLPHDALIVLPAVLVLRRPDAETATPWIVRGAVAIATVELLLAPTLSLATDLTGPQGAGGLTYWLALLAGLAKGVGWAAIGVGLTRLNPGDVRGPIAGLANIGFWLVAGTALFDVVSAIIGRNLRFEWLTLTVASQLGFAYFVRATLRGLEDPGRSLPATRVAATGALLAASMGFVGAVLTTFAIAGFPFTVELQTSIGVPLIVLRETVALTLLVVAFGLGFGDPLRPLAKDWEAAGSQA